MFVFEGFEPDIDDVARLASWFPNVQYLNFVASDDNLEELHRLTSLKQLGLEPLSYFNTGTGLMHLSRLISLTSLCMHAHPTVISSDDLLDELCSKGMRQLKRLEISGDCVTDLDIAILLAVLTRLTELSVLNCTDFTAASASTFLHAAPWLRRFCVGSGSRMERHRQLCAAAGGALQKWGKTGVLCMRCRWFEQDVT